MTRAAHHTLDTPFAEDERPWIEADEHGRLAVLVPCRTPLLSVPSVKTPDQLAPQVDGTAALQAHSVDETEAFEVLRSMAHGKAGALSAEALARHALAVTAGADFPVRRAAMEALLRRVSSARSGLRVVRPPPGRSPLGAYRVRRDGSPGDHTALVRSIDPPAGSCDCRDFARSSLGLCKHLFAALEHAAGRGGGRAIASPPVPTAGLEWDPVRPLTGTGDWLERVRWRDGEGGLGSVAAAASRRHFSRRDGRLKDAFAGEPARRLEAVRDMLRFARAGGRRAATSADAALLPLLAEEEARLERVLAAAWVGRDLQRLLRSMKHKLYPYQVEGVECFLRAGRLLLADDMGLGKTAQAIAACHVLFTAGKVTRGLVIVPATLKPQWLREWQTFSDSPVAIVDGGPEARAKAYRRCQRGFLLANYEQVLRDLPLMHRFRPDVVVLDEAQRIKNWATKTSAHVKRLEPGYRLVLTGTPMENRLEELASLVDWVDDMALEPKWRLAPQHSTFADGRREVTGAKNLDTLRARLSHCMVRRVRKEVLNQLPPRTDTRVPVPLTPEQQGEHDELNQPIASIVKRASARPLTQAEFLRLMVLLNTQRIICNGLAQLRFEETWPSLSAANRPTEALLAGLFSPKLVELRELVSNIAVAQERKVVVFSQWRRMLKLASWSVADILSSAGARSVFFTGEEGQRRRTQNLVDFHDDPSVRVLFATDAGGVGLNLQRAASCCVNLELPWNPAVLEQRIGRVYRMGQSRPVEVYHLVSEIGIEARIAGLVSDKRALFSGLFDGASDEVAFERSGSFLSRIERVLAPVRTPVVSEKDDEDASLDEAELSDALPPAAELRAAPAAGEGDVAAEPLSAEGVRELFSRVQVRPATGGKVVFEAPAEAATALAALFEGMARMLSGTSRRPSELRP
jgi:hypothetical protein